MKNKIPNYLKELIKKFPSILSGRKNYIKHHKRILKNLDLTKEYFSKIKK